MADNNQGQRRILKILAKLFAGERLTANAVATEFEISVRTAQRDLEQLATLGDAEHQLMVTKSHDHPAVYAARTAAQVSPGIILMLEKMLLETRALEPMELQKLLNAALSLAANEDVVTLQTAVAEEVRNYQPILSHQPRAKLLWQIQKAIEHKLALTVEYSDHARQYPPVVTQYTGVPLAVSFNQQYFHMTLHLVATDEIKELHLDWVTHLQVVSLEEQPAQPPAAIGKNRRRQAYGYRGKPVEIQFEYYGLTEYVTDQFAQAAVIDTLDKPNRWPFPVSLMEMKCDYSSGVRMWLITQSPILKVVSPQWIADDVKKNLQIALDRYEEN